MAQTWTGLINARDTQRESLKALYQDMLKEYKVDVGTRRTFTALRAVSLTRHPKTAAIGYVMAMKEAVRAGTAGIFTMLTGTTGQRGSQRHSHAQGPRRHAGQAAHRARR